MKRFAVFLLAAGLFYLASGFYVVRGNEKAAVRLFGRAARRPDGGLQLEAGGLHYALPWPFSQIARVNVNEVRTLSVGVNETDDIEAGGFSELETANQSQFLTGDQNILHLQINTQYHVSELAAGDFLFSRWRRKRNSRELSPRSRPTSSHRAASISFSRWGRSN